MLRDHNCFADPKETNRDVLSTLRRESLDIYNRLHSIEEDIGFVNHVHNHYSDFPLLPNLRCGAWYTDPSRAGEAPAYFKSTDGHTGNWGFNLRRANLHILPLVAEKHGILLVDSTRSGKRMPDALSKTVPIWCAVINRAIAIRRDRDENYQQTSEWDIDLYTPPGVVSGQEHDQILQKLDKWSDALAESTFDLPLELRAPLRPVWITPSTTSFPIIDPNSPSLTFLPIVCVCASKQVEAGAERRVAGYVYVQGSGDDHELWGMGLTPQLFWRYRSDLISSSRSDLQSLVEQIVSSPSPPVPLASFDVGATPTPIQRINGRIRLASFSPSSLGAVLAAQDPNMASVVLSFNSPDAGESLHNLNSSPDTTSPGNILHIEAGPRAKAKFEAYFLEHILPTTASFIRSHLSTRASNTVCILEGCGNELGTRLDVSVGIALVAIQLFFNENGEWLSSSSSPQADKKSIRTRLEWIISSEPRANPSRSTLKRVNEFLLTPSQYRTPST